MLVTGHPSRAFIEVADVVIGMETHKIGAHKPVDDVSTPGKQAKHLGRGKRDMQEEADGRIGHPLSEHSRKKHQVVIMYPDNVILTRDLGHLVAEDPVDAHVGIPEVVAVYGVEGKVMEERPDRLVGEAEVEVVDIILGEKNPVTPPLSKILPNLVLMPPKTFLSQSTPPYPQGIGSLVDGTQTGCDAAGARLDFEFPILLDKCYRQPV